MKSFLISDNRDTTLGMKLAGINGVVVHEKRAVLDTLGNALKDKDIGIIIITEKILKLAKDEIMELKVKREFPLVVVIPDRHGFEYAGDFITKYIRESVGLKI